MEQILFSQIKLEKLLEMIEEIFDKKLKQLDLQTNQTDPSKFLSRIEVATLLKITLPTLNEWTKLGWLQSYKMGNRVLYKLDEVKEALKKTAINKFKKYIL
jgi:excisionase family DNA binding protein